jgi:LPXTG-motif cell wall-anchored protein
MKRLRKLFALFISMVMTLTMASPAFADEAINNISVDTSVKVTGLQENDSVQFIQVIKWVDGSGWAYVDGLTPPTGKTLPNLTTITGGTETNTDPDTNITTTTVTRGAISAEHAAILAQAAMALTNKVGTTEKANANGVAEYTNAAAGLYFACVTPATADYLYNTIFVGADFKSDNTTNTIAANTAKVGGETNAVAKKEQITLDKESMPETANNADHADNIKYDHDLGEVIDFKISSKVPAFADGYVNPHYFITDQLEEGLELVGAGDTFAATDIVVNIENIELDKDDYTVSDYDSKQGFKVTVNKTGLDKVKATGNAQQITVTYKAKITSLDENNVTVTEKTNTATVNFSNKPTDENSYSLIEDKTRHYSFNLDANLLGKTGEAYTTDELIKVALGADGKPVNETQNYHSGEIWSAQSPLEGAKFALFTETPQDAWRASEQAATESGKLYNNGSFTGIVESDANGRLNISGLDANTNYYLVEITAPSGYIKDNRTFTINIDATYTEIPAGSYQNSTGITVNYNSYKVLSTYTVHVNDGTTTRDSIYTIEKVQEPVNEQKVDKATYKTITGEGAGEFAGDVMTPISNTQGTELPSTGGIGTTIFYIVGGVMVAGAVVFLLTKRRIAGNE